MANEFKPDVGKQVSKADALKWIDKYEKERKKDTKSVFFGRAAIEEILRLPGCTGISFFFTRKFNEGQKKDVDDLVMVGTTEDGTLLWNDNPPSALGNGGGSNTFNVATTCPPYCPK